MHQETRDIIPWTKKDFETDWESSPHTRLNYSKLKHLRWPSENNKFKEQMRHLQIHSEMKKATFTKNQNGLRFLLENIKYKSVMKNTRASWGLSLYPRILDLAGGWHFLATQHPNTLFILTFLSPCSCQKSFWLRSWNHLKRVTVIIT